MTTQVHFETATSTNAPPIAKSSDARVGGEERSIALFGTNLDAKRNWRNIRKIDGSIENIDTSNISLVNPLLLEENQKNNLLLYS